jgi:hypothetical protein
VRRGIFMQKRIMVVVFVALALAACRKEKSMQPMSEYESAEVQARAFNFLVYPAARLLQPETDVLKKASFVLQPGLKAAPPMVMYDTDAKLEDVAAFYAQKYGYTISDSDANFKAVKPKAYYTTGDLSVDTARIKPLLIKLHMSDDVSAASGTYRGAYIAPEINLPRVTLQRPYFDIVTRKVVDRTLIIMVRE